jgi:hypothetical protein
MSEIQEHTRLALNRASVLKSWATLNQPVQVGSLQTTGLSLSETENAT